MECSKNIIRTQAWRNKVHTKKYDQECTESGMETQLHSAFFFNMKPAAGSFSAYDDKTGSRRFPAGAGWLIYHSIPAKRQAVILARLFCGCRKGQSSHHFIAFFLTLHLHPQSPADSAPRSPPHTAALPPPPARTAPPWSSDAPWQASDSPACPAPSG